MAKFINFLKVAFYFSLQLSPYLVLGLIISGIINEFIDDKKIYDNFKKNNLFSVLKASFLGIPLPLCSCSVIPVASMLYKKGASKSSVLSFLVSTPTTGVDSILATYSLMGIVYAILRPIAALLNSVFVWIYWKVLKVKEVKKVEHNNKKDGFCEHCHKREVNENLDFKVNNKKSIFDRIKSIIYFAFIDNFSEIVNWLFIGVFIGALITVFVPNNITYISSNLFFSYALMITVSLPLYVCATGSIPIAASLLNKGFSPGSVLVFLILGPATNTTTLSFVFGKLGKSSFLVYILSIITIGFSLGLFLDLFLLKYINVNLLSNINIVNEEYNILSYLSLFILFISYLFILYYKINKKLT